MVAIGLLAYSLFIIWVSLRASGTQVQFAPSDKVLHAGAYAVLAVGAFLYWPKMAKWKLWLGCMLYGVLMECGQAFLTVSRTASVGDAVANGLGAALALVICSLAAKLWLSRQA